jgi:TPR repeat protein
MKLYRALFFLLITATHFCDYKDSVKDKISEGIHLFNAGNRLNGLLLVEQQYGELQSKQRTEHRLYLETRVELGILYLRDRQFEKSDEMLLPLFEKMKQGQGEDSLFLFEKLYEVVKNWAFLNRFREALKVLKELKEYGQTLKWKLQREFGRDAESVQRVTERVRDIEADAGYYLMKLKAFEQAVKILKPLLRNEHPLASYCMGAMYMTGRGLSKDLVLGLKFLIQAGNKAVIDAAAMLGMVYDKGDKLVQDKFKAWTWYRMAYRLVEYRLESEPESAPFLVRYSPQRYLARSKELSANMDPKKVRDLLEALDKKFQAVISGEEISEGTGLQLAETQVKDLLGKKTEKEMCFENQKKILQALEMYELDNGEPFEIHSLKDMKTLARLGYFLEGIPLDPGHETQDNYRSDSSGNVWCMHHGIIGGECAPASDDRCQKGIKPIETGKR